MNHAGDKCTEWAPGRCGSLGADSGRSSVGGRRGESCLAVCCRPEAHASC